MGVTFSTYLMNLHILKLQQPSYAKSHKVPIRKRMSKKECDPVVYTKLTNDMT
jgi:hypothetical protein